jgi:hypothetical protein
VKGTGDPGKRNVSFVVEVQDGTDQFFVGMSDGYTAGTVTLFSGSITIGP